MNQKQMLKIIKQNELAMKIIISSLKLSALYSFFPSFCVLTTLLWRIIILHRMTTYPRRETKLKIMQEVHQTSSAVIPKT